MALYEGLRNGGEAPRPAPQAWKRMEARTQSSSSTAPFLDRLLGQGTSQVLGKAVGQALSRVAKPRSAETHEARMQPKRMQAIGAGEGPVPRGRKGIGRVLIALLALSWVVVALRPWQRANDLKMDFSALFTANDAASEAKRLLAARRAASAESARLAALPVVAGTGRPLGLWQDGLGRWYKVDGNGILALGGGPASRDSLGLPELRGVAALSEEHRSARRLHLDLPSGRVDDLLPLDSAVASEIRAVDLSDPANPVLLTHEGVRCLIGKDSWPQRQKRLALVLADLAARKRRVGLIDLRYEDTAVVRPAGR